ncbi:hypothetical protein B9Q02_08900 [Candidatus Marsarchaeota G1 archaeon BE_D]|jgi:Coenzyme F420-dependent N5,N10-methylene tetrahydromethanopterin reductase and related flavin-dependent oxidoreductases|uniref:Luciferase-like domain-containing protein n=1 Tax=Candidatus Marsarchaeota G1 archaeon BE_D TaxID=1978156 RepID=A0A2R6AEF2_9ARCH|nr:MAG: hypothetical protein B9Q02_08900 [Candidatus Marsarchaeota G1 archaeon BE_D]
MKFSVALEGDRVFAFYLKALKILEEHEFFSLQLYEHLGFKPAWSTSFLLAPFSKKVRIGVVTVPCAFVHPLYTGANALVLNEVTKGRALLGISRGAFYESVSQSPKNRLQALVDTLEILKALFSKSKKGYQGKVYSLPKGRALRFRYSGRPVIYGGSSGPRTISLLCSFEIVDGIVVDNLWNPSYVSVVLDAMKKGSPKGAKELVARPFCVVVEEESERKRARKLAIRTLAKYLPKLVDGSPMLSFAGITQEAFNIDEVLENFCAFGNASEIVEQTFKMFKSGVTHVCYGLPLGVNSIRALKILAQKVKPHFTE